MPRFYFEVHTDAGVEQDTTGVDVGDPMTVLYECLEVIGEAIGAAEFDRLKAVTIKDENDTAVASLNIEAIRRATRLASNGEGSADQDPR